LWMILYISGPQRGTRGRHGARQGFFWVPAFLRKEIIMNNEGRNMSMERTLRL
jgi:hypothetical protein